jgi:hypothetical protein
MACSERFWKTTDARLVCAAHPDVMAGRPGGDLPETGDQ